MENKKYSCELKSYGITVIPILKSASLRKKILKDIKKMMTTFPEYKRDKNNKNLTPDKNKIIYVLGGFGAFGNPSSFHHPILRQLREWVMSKVIPIMHCYIRNCYPKDYKKYKFQQLIDRFSLRRKGTAPSKEAWHRDISPDQSKGDIIFGGWLNLDENITQYFSCIPGSHNDIEQDKLKAGFAIFPKKEHKNLNSIKKKIAVPPGHLIIFPQHIAHEVLSTKAKEDSYRLYIGWRLSKDKNPIQDIHTVLDTQAVPRLPSNQKPPIYSNNHGSFFVDKRIIIDPEKKFKQNLQEWSLGTFKDNIIERKVRGSGKKKGESYMTAHKHMNSLKDYGLKMYRKYKTNEKKIFIPHNSWNLSSPTNSSKIKYTL